MCVMYPKVSCTCSHTIYTLTHHKHVHLHAIPPVHTCTYHPYYILCAYTYHTLPQHTQTCTYAHIMCLYIHTCTCIHTMPYRTHLNVLPNTCACTHHGHHLQTHHACIHRHKTSTQTQIPLTMCPQPCLCPQAPWKVPQSLTLL